MSLPSRIAARVSGGDLVLPDGKSLGECEGSRFHSPTPLFVHTVPAIPTQWSPYPVNARGKTLLLCGTCKDNYEFLLSIFHTYNGHLPVGMAREMGNQMRELVREAWALYGGDGG